METFRKKIDYLIRHERIGDQPVVRILIRRTTLLDSIAVFGTILEDLGTAVVILPDLKTCGLELSDTGTEVHQEAGNSRVGFSRGDLSTLYGFLLRYYRVGLAEVDHLDFDASVNGEPGGCLTIAFEESVLPVSGAEARRRLGL